ncbi:hypothetical protein CPC08DRAFT_729109 [Agrocybe pediades]|nr:hypothetical protein CPC08DRAFT_729109 [Agrocybe pediades]
MSTSAVVYSRKREQNKMISATHTHQFNGKRPRPAIGACPPLSRRKSYRERPWGTGDSLGPWEALGAFLSYMAIYFKPRRERHIFYGVFLPKFYLPCESWEKRNNRRLRQFPSPSIFLTISITSLLGLVPNVSYLICDKFGRTKRDDSKAGYEQTSIVKVHKLKNEKGRKAKKEKKKCY